ncbi:MAG: hypothetical protein MJ212_05585 [Alphaproteobacteria bacterium]|nr:hypothetical protein [Alphaproteobacteria bacterium]
MKVLMMSDAEGSPIRIVDNPKTAVKYLFDKSYYICDADLEEYAKTIEELFNKKITEREEMKLFLMTKTIDEINQVFEEWLWLHEMEVLTEETLNYL